MRIPAGLDDNFRFMVLEVSKQVEEALAFLAEPSPTMLDRIVGRDDYIDSMKGLIEEKSFSFLASQAVDRSTTNLLRCLNTIASNLERIADFAVSVVEQVKYLRDPRFPARYDYPTFFDEVLTGLEIMMEALGDQDVNRALRICQCEFRLDALFQTSFNQILEDMTGAPEVGDMVTSLFIYRYLERMGDSLLNIGEALLFLHVGERLKIHQYQALHDTLAASGMQSPLAQVEFASFWGNRSGCKVASVSDKEASAQGRRVVFKEGHWGKIIKEKDNIERWNSIQPGLVPRVFGYQDLKPQASILLEYLGGCTMQEVLQSAEDEILQNASFLLKETLTLIWNATRSEQACQARFTKQIQDRLDDIFRIHPYFRRPSARLAAMEIPSLGQLLYQLGEVELELKAPFTVFCHGDFNLNNIIYDHNNQRLHYIDLYRSHDGDYVEDVGVLMVSCFRLPLNGAGPRGRIKETMAQMLAFARDFAARSGDRTFEARLALGLARSLLTSTRFELNEVFARDMYLRSLYLMERILDHRPRAWEDFRLPPNALSA
jgi:phosphate uptake regulator